MTDFIPLAAVGLASGFVAGLVGLAGGIVVVPALTWLYGPDALHAAIVISWFAVLVNSISAARTQFRIRGRDERRQLLATSKWFLIGAAVITPFIAIFAVEAKKLLSKELVAVLQICLAVVMLMPMKEVEIIEGGASRRPLMDASFGGLVGSVSTLIGVGGGTYTIAYFVYCNGAKFRDAIAAANMTGLAVGLLSVVGFAASHLFGGGTSEDYGPISLTGMALLIVAGAAAAPVGVAVSRKVATGVLKKILIGSLLISAFRLLV